MTGQNPTSTKILLTNLQSFTKLPEFLEASGQLLVYVWSGEHNNYWRDKQTGYLQPYTLQEAYNKCKGFKPYKVIEFHTAEQLTVWALVSKHFPKKTTLSKLTPIYLQLQDVLLATRHHGFDNWHIAELKLYPHQIQVQRVRSKVSAWLVESVVPTWQELADLVEGLPTFEKAEESFTPISEAKTEEL